MNKDDENKNVSGGDLEFESQELEDQETEGLEPEDEQDELQGHEPQQTALQPQQAAALQATTAKPGEKKPKAAKPEKAKESLFGEVNGEFKKIVWPTRRELVKQTTTVIMVALMFGVIIFLMDSV
ncbi:MAG: preprotein translocase subunit SecE, partial [Defluviitaleaceae bacterium]|nr:preprotein translocase subunit SecE [Defluviitaleaceae bacterium]